MPGPSSSRPLVRYIGVDFGTSTSAIVCKDYYQGGKDISPDLQRPEIDPDSPAKNLIPTVIFIDAQGQKFFGQKAQKLGTSIRKQSSGSRFITNFKMDLVSKDKERRHSAEVEMDDFFRFLYPRYEDTRYFAAESASVEERTYVGYPEKWPDAIRQRTLAAATKAGFPNVKGMDEPTAAMQCFLTTETEAFRRLANRGIVQPGADLNILLLDMGAGTTDLVLFRYSPGSTKHEVLATWPPVDDPGTFGGREIDQRLLSALKTMLPNADPAKVESYLAQQSLAIREWKEDISRALRDRDETDIKPNFLTALDFLGADAGILDFPIITRRWIEQLLADYLPVLPRLIDGLFEAAQGTQSFRSSQAIDLVVLTGGHCQWYFIKEILGGDPRFGAGRRVSQLSTIWQDPSRIIVTPNPQETVAAGMALLGKPLTITKRVANNCWLEIEVSESAPLTLAIVQSGQLLPYRHTILKRFPAVYRVEPEISVEWTSLAGSSLQNALRSDPSATTLSVTNWLELAAVFFVSAFTPVAPSTATIFIEVQVDEDEHLTALCLIKGGDGFKDFQVFSINSTSPTAADREGLRSRYEAYVAAGGK